MRSKKSRQSDISSGFPQENKILENPECPTDRILIQIKQIRPDLLRDISSLDKVLMEIKDYLLQQSNLENKTLESLLGKDLFLSMYGLKALMENKSFAEVHENLERKQKKFLQRLDDYYDEEE